MPVYDLPPDNDRIQVMRIVVRAHFSRSLVGALVRIFKWPFNNSLCNPMPSPSEKISLNGAKDILDFFRENQKPLFYVSTSTYRHPWSRRMDRQSRLHQLSR